MVLKFQLISCTGVVTVNMVLADCIRKAFWPCHWEFSPSLPQGKAPGKLHQGPPLPPGTQLTPASGIGSPVRSTHNPPCHRELSSSPPQE